MVQDVKAVLGPVERQVRPGDRSEMSESREALLAAFGAASAAREQDLRGQYPKAARVLAEEVFRLRAALRQKHAEYDDMKSLLLGNARNLNLELERTRLRAAQAESVMPLIGPLLDAWECCSQDVRSEHPELDVQLRRINRAMEDAGDGPNV